MSLYHEDVAAAHVLLPEEAPDVTVTRLHVAVLNRLYHAARVAAASSAVVLTEIFLRVGGDYTDTGEQVSPDLLLIPATSTTRTEPYRVYRVPENPVPTVTLEVLSYANYRSEGRRQLEHKRDLLGRIGVPTHIEIDPERRYLTTWTNTAPAGEGGRLQPDGAPSLTYEGDALAGIHLAFDEEPDPSTDADHLRQTGDYLRIWLPSGREYLDPTYETAELEQSRARLEQMADALRRAGIDPDTL